VRAENFYWTWSGIIVVLILSTLFLDRETLVEIQVSGLNVTLFLTGMVLVGLAVLSHGLRRPGSSLIWFIVFGLMAVYAMIFFRYLVAAERSHLIEFSVLTLFLYEGFQKRREQNHDWIRPGWMAFATATLIGIIDESLQLLVPNRVFDWNDMVFNSMAAAFAVFSSTLFTWVKKRFS